MPEPTAEPLFDPTTGKLRDRAGLLSTARGIGPAGEQLLADTADARVTRTDAGVNVQLRGVDVGGS